MPRLRPPTSPFGVDQFAGDGRTLRFRDDRAAWAKALIPADSKSAECAALYRIVDQRRAFADNRRAGRHLQHAAARDPGRRLFW